jgi:hypothetical protein
MLLGRNIRAHEFRQFWDGGPDKIDRFLKLHGKVCAKNKFCSKLLKDLDIVDEANVDLVEDSDEEIDELEQESILRSEPPELPAPHTPAAGGSAPVSPQRPARRTGREAYNAGMLSMHSLIVIHSNCNLGWPR